MLNPSEFYRELGKKAAEARNVGDEACAAFHAQHFRAAKALEMVNDRQVADRPYRQSYASSRRT